MGRGLQSVRYKQQRGLRKLLIHGGYHTEDRACQRDREELPSFRRRNIGFDRIAFQRGKLWDVT